MKIVVRQGMKLDLPLVLSFVPQSGWTPTRLLLDEIQRRFDCKLRAAQDAISILRAGGWIKHGRAKGDHRKSGYRITAKGKQALALDEGWRELRLSRWQYSTTSTRARKRRAATRMAPAARCV